MQLQPSSVARRELCDDALKVLFKSNKHITKLHLPRCDLITVAAYIAIGDHLPRLQHCQLCTVTADTDSLVYIATKCRHIRSFILQHRYNSDIEQRYVYIALAEYNLGQLNVLNLSGMTYGDYYQFTQARAFRLTQTEALRQLQQTEAEETASKSAAQSRKCIIM